MSPPSPAAFAAALRGAEERLRACGLTGRDAFSALCQHLAAQLGLEPALWPQGPPAPPAARLDDIPLPEPASIDLFGLAYERFFSDLFKSERGQYFTPQPLVELMADLAEIAPGDRVLDPTCGTGGFLIVAHRRSARVSGVEVDPDLVRLCRLNLALSGADPAAVSQADFFAADHPTRWDVVLANPPFTVPVEDVKVLGRYELSRGQKRASSDSLFLEAAWRRLRPGGRLVAVLPRSVLANVRAAPLRDWIDARFVRRAVVTLPEGVFRPFGGTSAHAVVVSLQRRPAQPRPWIAAAVTQPGYDPSRKVYLPTEPDELAILRAELAAGTAHRLPAQAEGWLPEHLGAEDSIAGGVPRQRLTVLAPYTPTRLRPAEQPEQRFTEVDLADADRSTGEVRSGRARAGAAFVGEKCAFWEGDVLFSRLRPSLNKVVVAARPDPALPEAMCGSAEWLRLTPTPEEAHFALLAARSSFVRAQLRGTSGQTRPRVRAADLHAVEVPDPGPELRAAFSEIVRDAHRRRLEARRTLDEAARLYEEFGRGKLDEDGLRAALAALR